MTKTGTERERIGVVIARTPGQTLDRPARERVADQRRAARRALRVAAERAGCPDETFEKSSARGRPEPSSGGWHWTISHDATFVAAAVRRAGPVGVDLEKIELRRRMLVERVANPGERRVLGEGAEPLDALGFARLWTSKEAVLKAERIGLPGLDRCRVTAVRSDVETELTYDGETRRVWHTRIEDHLVSLCLAGYLAPRRVLWIVPARSHGVMIEPSNETVPVSAVRERR